MGTSRQQGFVTLRGKQWYGYFRKIVNDPVTSEKKTVRVTVVLGPRSKMSKGEARETLQREITKQIGQPGSSNKIMNDGSVTFAWFVRNRFFPLKESSWNEQTAQGTKYLIERELIDHLGEIPLVNFDKFSLQIHLNNLALTRAKYTVLKMRIYLRAIFAEAVDQDFLVKDPAHKLKTPTQLRDTDKTILSWEQLRSVLSGLPLRDRILLELGMTNALRPGELFAFRWKCFDQETATMNIIETVYRGKIRPWAKTKKSLAPIHLPISLAEELEAWRNLCPDPSPEAFIFPNKFGGFLDSHNYRQRVFHRLAEDLDLPKLTFQVIRRSIATLAQRMGSVKDVQGVLRHSRAPTTTDVYMQVIPEGVQSTINSISRELKKPQPISTSLAVVAAPVIAYLSHNDVQIDLIDRSMDDSNHIGRCVEAQSAPKANSVDYHQHSCNSPSGYMTEGELLQTESSGPKCLNGDLPVEPSLDGRTDSAGNAKILGGSPIQISRKDVDGQSRQHHTRAIAVADPKATDNISRLVTASPELRARYNREELYEKTWRVPMRILAKEYGISDVALAKTCRKLCIPVPGRGYWAKREANKPVASQPPLPTLRSSRTSH